MTKKHLLMLGAGLMQRPALEAARRLNCHITVADGNPNALCASMADVFEPIDLKDVDGLKNLAQKMKDTHGLDGVFTAGTDFSASVANVANAFNLPGHSVDAALNASDKFRMRQCFEKADVPSPKFVKVKSTGNLENIDKLVDESTLSLQDLFPLVVKPVDNMGGRGCRMVYTKLELIEAVKDAITFSRSGTAIVEEYMDGPEFSVDSLVYNGKITITGLADRHIFYPPYFIEMGHTMPSAFSQTDIDSLISVFKQGVLSLGLSCGAAKGDIKLTKNGPMIGEIAARLSGGYMSGWTYPYASGVDLTEQGLRLALGMEPQIKLDGTSVLCNAFSAERAWLSIPGKVAEVTGLTDAEKTVNIKNVFQRSKPNDIVCFPQNNVEKCGNIISFGSTREQAIQACEDARKKIVVRLQANNSDTNDFLTMPLNTAYPPSAYQLPTEVIDKINSNVLASKNLLDVPEELKDYENTLFDWNGKSITFALTQFKSIVYLSKCQKISYDKFWKAFIRGGLQGILYLADSE